MAEHGVSATSTIGQAIQRVEGRSKVTGQARYTADVPMPGALWGAILRSPYPHARIRSVDASRARQADGVHAVLTGHDLSGRFYGRAVLDVPILASDRVRFIGDPVAAVAAETLAAAREALKLIDVDYEELPAVFDPFEAMAAGAPILHPDFHGYRVVGSLARAGMGEVEHHWGTFGAGQVADALAVPNLVFQETKQTGDVAQGFREAEVVLEGSYVVPSQHQGYIEPHTCLVRRRERRQGAALGLQ